MMANGKARFLGATSAGETTEAIPYNPALLQAAASALS